MKAGTLRHELTIRSKVNANDGYGDAGTAATTVVATVWGSLEPSRGREFQTGQQRSSEQEFTVRIRYSSNFSVTSANEILFGSRVFEIVSPPRNIDERGITLEFECRELLT